MVNFLKFSSNEKLLKCVVTPLSSTHAYKAEGGGTFLRCGIAKKAKKLQGTCPLSWS